MARLNHASIYADDPKRAAEHLRALVGGTVTEFHPVPGGYACLFDGEWSGQLIELYPKTHRIGWVDGQPAFVAMEQRATGAGTHFNITVDKTREQIEAVCKERGLQHAWRDWASFVDVLLEDGLVVEIVPG